LAETRVLVSCRLVWDARDRVRDHLEKHGVAADFPHFDGQQLEEADLIPMLGNYDGILAGDDHLSRVVLESATPRLRVISKWGIGVDAIDSDAASELGIEVFNTPGVFGEELADYAMGFIHLLARRQHEVNERVKQGSWHKVRGVSLAGKALGVIGLGSSGRALVRRAVASGMHALGCDELAVGDIPGCEVLAMERVLSHADVVSLHVPATPQTRHLIDAKTLASMKQGAWLVNTSRGSLVDETALVDALRSGRIGAAALDVFEKEPVAPDNPLLAFDNVIAGAHNGSNTDEAVERTTWLAVSNLLQGLGLAEESR
jgi:D-3-phosphoglycerate dehydrogenase / 2-oxoglutarate reductase